MKYIFIAIYYLIANKLPSSFFPLGFFFNSVRLFLLRRFVEIGEGCLIEPGVNLGKGDNIIIGKNCQINERVYIQSAVIGDYVLIAPNVSIIGMFHAYGRMDIPMALQGITKDIPPIIEDDVWIGRNVVVMPGIKIGKGSIVGSNAVVTNDIEPYSIVGGVPAKFIKRRERELEA